MESIITKFWSSMISYEFLLKYLVTFQDIPQDAITPQIKQYAIEVIKKAIATPQVLVFEDIKGLTVISAITSSKWTDLLDIFVNKTCQEYDNFVLENPTFIQDNGLNHEDNLRKIRVLTLSSLATSHVQKELAYAKISQALNIPNEDVEYWVIDGIYT